MESGHWKSRSAVHRAFAWMNSREVGEGFGASQFWKVFEATVIWVCIIYIPSYPLMVISGVLLFEV